MCLNVQWNRKGKQKICTFLFRRPRSARFFWCGRTTTSRRKLISKNLLRHLMDLFWTPPHDNDSVRWNWMLTNDKTQNWHLRSGQIFFYLQQRRTFSFWVNRQIYEDTKLPSPIQSAHGSANTSTRRNVYQWKFLFMIFHLFLSARKGIRNEQGLKWCG